MELPFPAKVKEAVGHGNFKKWIEDNMPISYSQCNRYLKLFQSKPELTDDSKVLSTRLLTLDAEYLLLSTSNEIETEIREVVQEEIGTR